MHCSKWSAWTQASSLVRHWPVALSTTLCWNSHYDSTSCCRNSSFCISLGSAVTFYRLSGQIYSRLVSSFLRSQCTTNYRNRFIFDRVIPKINKVTFFGTQCSATSNHIKVVHWPLLLHLVQRGRDWAGPQPTHSPPRCTKCNSPPINGQRTIRVLLYIGTLLCSFNVSIKGCYLHQGWIGFWETYVQWDPSFYRTECMCVNRKVAWSRCIVERYQQLNCTTCLYQSCLTRAAFSPTATYELYATRYQSTILFFLYVLTLADSKKQDWKKWQPQTGTRSSRNRFRKDGAFGKQLNTTVGPYVLDVTTLNTRIYDYFIVWS